MQTSLACSICCISLSGHVYDSSPYVVLSTPNQICQGRVEYPAELDLVVAAHVGLRLISHRSGLFGSAIVRFYKSARVIRKTSSWLVFLAFANSDGHRPASLHREQSAARHPLIGSATLLSKAESQKLRKITTKYITSDQLQIRVR